MAFSCVTINVFSIIVLVILSITPLSSSFSPQDKVTKALVEQLCSKPTIYKHFCISWLTSDPKTFTVDLQGLVNMVFPKTEVLGYKNLDMIRGLGKTTTDPKLKIAYRSCVKEYELSTKAIKEAKGFASSKAYLLAYKAAFRTFDSISICEAYLKGQKMPAYATF